MAKTDVALTRHVADIFPELDTLFEAGEAADSVQQHPGWAVVQAVLEAEIATIQESLERKQPYEQAEYASLHGRVAGLRGAQRAVVAVVAVARKRREQQAAKHEGDAEPSPER